MNQRLDQIPPETDVVLIAANPRAGASSSAAAVANLADTLNRQRLQARVITNLDELQEEAHAAQAAGRLRAVVGAGGDGTLQELVNRTSAATPLACFPLGTANLMAGYLGLRAQVAEFASMLVGGKAVRIDAARATWLDPAAPRSRIFLVTAGVGFDGVVIERLHRERAGHKTGHISYLSYAKPILASLRTYSYPQVRVEYVVESPCRCSADAAQSLSSADCPTCNSDPAGQPVMEAFQATWLFVQNVPCYAGGLNFTPLAVGTDGLLDVCTFQRGSLWHGLRYLTNVWLQRHPRLADCRMLRTRKLRITSDQRPPVQLDGDAGGQLPLEIEVLPARVRMLVPAALLDRLQLTGKSQPAVPVH